MHHRTYERLLERLCDCDERRDGAMAVFLGRIVRHPGLADDLSCPRTTAGAGRWLSNADRDSTRLVQLWWRVALLACFDCCADNATCRITALRIEIEQTADSDPLWEHCPRGAHAQNKGEKLVGSANLSLLSSSSIHARAAAMAR